MYGEQSPLLGNIVCAKIKVSEKYSKSETVKEVRRYCLTRMERYKVPVKVILTGESLVSIWQKKTRS